MKSLHLLGFLALIATLPVGAQVTEFGNLLVTQNDSGNNTTSVTVLKGPGSSPNFNIRSGSNKADYNITFGTANDYLTGVALASVTENGRNNDLFGETIGTFFTTVSVEIDNAATPSRYILALERSPQGVEQNANVACAFLPYSQWLGGAARNLTGSNGGVTDTLQASAGINLGTQFTTLGSGAFGLDLTSIDVALTSQNGVLLVNHLRNEDNYAASRANANGTFSMFVRDNGSSGSGNEQDPIAFVYLRTSDVGTKFLKAVGRVNSDATTDLSGGTFTMTKGGTGQWFLTIPGMSPDKGVLIVSPEGGGTNNTDNIVSYQWEAANSRYVIESRDIVASNGAHVLEDGANGAEDMFSFAFFEAPIVPVVTLTAPTNGTSYVAGTDFEVAGTATDANGTVTQVEFLRNGAVVATDTTAPYSYNEVSLAAGGYSYRMRATDNDGFVVTSDPVNITVTLDPANIPANTALWFDGVNDHVTMGVAPELGVGGPPNNGMTLECWFRQDGEGVTGSSGSGGISVVPLFSRGRGESDNSNLDCNYLFGITTGGLLAADFETYPATGLSAGQNYPITGTNTPITSGVWHHAAVTYDGATATWTLYLNGTQVGSTVAAVGALPRYDSIQHFGIATAMNSTGVTQGAFLGAIDEVRVWDHARTAQQIVDSKDLGVRAAPGLVGRFGLNEGEGLTTTSSTGAQNIGTLVNGPLWINGAAVLPSQAPTVEITATDAVAAEVGADSGTFRITRSGDTTALLSVSYTVATGAGRATSGDYSPALTGTATIAAGQSFVDIIITAVDDFVLEGAETVALTLKDTFDYDLGAATAATVTIADDETNIDLSRYVRVGRYDLPEPTRTTPPSGNLLGQEASGVAYNWDTDTLFIVGDGGTSVTEVSKTGALVSAMTLSGNGNDFLDTEGITYIGAGQFVLTEERVRQAVKFTYVGGSTLTPAAVERVKLGTTIGNIGLEGLSYDPQTSGFLFAKESDPQGLFQTTINFTAGTASNGSPTTVNSTNLFNPALASLDDMSDVFAFSNLVAMTGQPRVGNLLILSQESGLIRHVDRSGNILSTLTLVADVGNPLTIQNQTHEGVTMDREGRIYVVSENGGGDIDHPQLWVYEPSNVTNTAPTAIVLSTASTTIPENTSTAAAVKMANFTVTDVDGVGINSFSVSGTDAAHFQVIGTALYLKAGTVLNNTTKPSYSVTVNVDDTSVGSTPDASANFTLNVTPVVSGSSSIRITEVAPWSSGNSPGVTADWFELTNTGTTAVDITGWKMNDSAASFGSAGPLSGITSIGAGESVIFVDGQTKIAGFLSNWFGASPPAGIQVGFYGGPGLSTGGDSVTIYDAGGTLQARVDFGASPVAAPFGTFDNTAGLNNATVTLLSAIGQNGAFTASATANEIGSPGAAAVSSTVLVSITATDATAAEEATEPGTFRITRTGSTTLAMDVVFSITTGSGQATSGDYTPALVSPATILAGASFVDVTITPVDDALAEGPETLTLTLGDTGSYDVGSPASATVTITDNDTPNMAPTAVSLTNTVSSIQENTRTTSPIKVADIVVTDDGIGTNTLSLTGADAASFQITGSSLFLKSGVVLDFETKTSYAVTVNVDDTTVGATPDATADFTLNVTDQALEIPALIVTEVSPWSSTLANSPLEADWFEVTNVSSTAVDITGWKVDDSSNAFVTAIALNGVTSIAPGESVIFVEGTSVKAETFKTNWFGANPPAGLQVGSYTGSGIGLSGTSDAVNLYTAAGAFHSGVTFGASDAVSPFQTFDNTTAVFNTTISLLSVVGTNGAFAAANSPNEIGSPGFSAPGVLRITEVTPWGSSNSLVAADWFEVTNVGARAVDISGWKVDDSSASFAVALALNGITSIAAGESVIFVEGTSTTVDSFKTNWFGASPPSGLQVGSYTGSGIGLSGNGDAVNLYNAAGVLQAGVTFGVADAVSPYQSFDNSVGADNTAISLLSELGANGAFVAVNSPFEIGSPGTTVSAAQNDTTIVISDATIAEGASGSATLAFTVTRSDRNGAFTVDFSTSNGTATAGSDYTATSGTLTFLAGGSNTQSVSVAITGDTNVEPNETFIVTLSNVVNTAGTATITDATATGTITNDDITPVAFPASNSLTSTVKGSIALAGAEIPAFDPLSDRAFTSSGAGIQVRESRRSSGSRFHQHDSAFHAWRSCGLISDDISSVTVRKGSGPIPACSPPPSSAIQRPARFVIFLNAATGALIGHATVGVVPDHIAWTPDGSKLLVCNEGELSTPEVTIATIPDAAKGTVSIIPVDAAGCPRHGANR
jgi:uncharacterized protein YjiK